VRITTVFNKLLQLQGAFVRGVQFAAGTVRVTVAKRRRQCRCPHCGYTTGARYDRRRCWWRHVGLGKQRVIIEAELSRVDCPVHGVVTEAVPWAATGSRFTRDFEDLVAWLAREMNKTAVSRVMRTAWVTVGEIIERVVDRNIDGKRLEKLFVIGLDEVSYRKGHKYISIVADHRTGDPVWIGEGRSGDTVGKFFDELGSVGLPRFSGHLSYAASA
jgi:transposase